MVDTDGVQANVKPDSLSVPEAEITDQELSDILNTPTIQSLMEEFTKLTDMTTAILDLKGNILVASGWREICTQFHRVHPQTAKNCTESDLFLANHVRPGEYVAYKCKNNLWDVVTPVYVEGRHVANIYTGQFFYDTDVVDDELFVNQAKQYGFDPEKYLAALHRVPRFSREKFSALIGFLVKFTGLVSQLGAGNLRLARARAADQHRFSETLRETEARFRSLFEQAPEAIIVYDFDLNQFVDANRNAERLFECRREDLLNYGPKRFYTAAQPDGCPVEKSFREHNQRALAGEELAFERTVCNAGGKIIDCEVRLTRLPSAEHNLLRASFIDITERKQAEKALRTSESFLNSLIDQSPYPMWVSDDQGNLLRINQACRNLLNVTNEDVVGKYNIFQDNIVRENGLVPLVRRVYEAGETVRFNLTYDSSRLKPLRLTLPTIVILDVTIFPIRDGAGKITNAVIQHQDVTERERAEEALRQEKIFSDTIIESLPGTFYVINRQGRFIRWNKAVEELLGLPSDQVSQVKILETIHEDDRDLITRKISEIFDKGHAEVEARSQAKGTPYLFFSAQKMDIGGESYIVGTGLNITDRKRAEEEVKKLNEELEQRVKDRTAQLEAANKELEAFSYSVSHDLRAPLRSIDGFSHIIIEDYEDKLDDQGKDYLMRIRRGCQRMAELIDDLLNLSRIARSELTLGTVDLTALAQEITVGLQAGEPQRRVEWIIAEGLRVNADANLMRVVLENLLGNAWKFTQNQPEAKIELGIIRQEEQPVYFVRDNGVGFDMAFADKLFGAFQRLHTREEFEGTGIGLATVHRIIRRHGGRIWVESRVNQGTTFYFTLLEKG